MSPQRYIFRKRRQWFTSPLVIFALLGMILSGLFVTQGFRRGEVKPLFMPTPTPTRVAGSFAGEAEMHFQAGNLNAAIASYQDAIGINPNNGRLYADMARIMTYSTESLATEQEKQARFDQALQAANQAVKLAPDDSTAYAVRAFVLDWYASFLRYILSKPDDSAKQLTEAEQTVSRAITLDETNVLAQVFRAEIMIDQQRWDQADSSIRAALNRDPNLWDAHRVNGLFLESQGYYLDSIKEFEMAVKLAPNMTFLYIKLGQSYRTMGLRTGSKDYYTQAIANFAKAAALNEQLGIKDPLPYLGIGRAYAQIGEFYISSLNMNKALQFDPSNPDVYAQLGMVYRQARNYEDAISALKCAVRGCNADDTCKLRNCNPDVDQAIEIKGMGLNGLTIVYYYTYASLLAAMYQPHDPNRATYCTDATALIGEIRSSTFGNDTTITDILAESESICRSMLSAAAQTPSVTPTGNGTLPRGIATSRAPTPKPTITPRRTPTLFPSPTPAPYNGG